MIGRFDITLPLRSQRIVMVRIAGRFCCRLRHFQIMNEEQLVEMSHRLYRSVLDARFWPLAALYEDHLTIRGPKQFSVHTCLSINTWMSMWGPSATSRYPFISFLC